MRRAFIAVGQPRTAYIAKAHIVSVTPRGDGVLIDLVNGHNFEVSDTTVEEIMRAVRS